MVSQPERADAEPNRTTTTDANGAYVVDGLTEHGNYAVLFDKPGSDYLQEAWPGSHAFDNWQGVDPATDGSASAIDAALERGGVVSGTVRDASGNPLEGICVSADASNPETGEYNRAFTCTDSAGAYRIVMLPGVMSSLYLYDPNGIYLSQSYPAEQDAPVIATLGTELTGIDLTMTTGAGVTATVSDQAGTAVAGVCLALESVSDWNVYSGTACSDAQGHVRSAGAPAGDYRVAFYGEHIPKQYYGGSFTLDGATVITLTPPQDLDLGTVVVRLGATVTGTIRLAGGGSPSGVTVRAELQPIWSGPGVTGVVASDGSYTLSGIAPGTYQIIATGPWGTDYLETRYADAAGSNDLTVADGDALTGLNITLPIGGSISGTVTSEAGQPIANAWVSLTPAAGATPTPYYTTADANGVYTIHAVAPGSYAVRASGQGFEGEYYHNAFGLWDATWVTVTGGQPCLLYTSPSPRD